MKEKTSLIKRLATLPASANGTMYPGHFILLLPMILLDMGSEPY
jgi:hypothetical protein